MAQKFGLFLLGVLCFIGIVLYPRLITLLVSLSLFIPFSGYGSDRQLSRLRSYAKKLLEINADTSLCEQATGVPLLLNTNGFTAGIKVSAENLPPEKIRNLMHQYKAYDLMDLGLYLIDAFTSSSKPTLGDGLRIYLVPFASSFYSTAKQEVNFMPYVKSKPHARAFHLTGTNVIFADDFCNKNFRTELNKYLISFAKGTLENLTVSSLTKLQLQRLISAAEHTVGEYLTDITRFHEFLLHETFHFFQDQIMFKHPDYQGISPEDFLDGIYYFARMVHETNPDYLSSFISADFLRFLYAKGARRQKTYLQPDYNIFDLSTMLTDFKQLALNPPSFENAQQKYEFETKLKNTRALFSHGKDVSEFSVRLVLGTLGYTDSSAEEKVARLSRNLGVSKILRNNHYRSGNIPATNEIINFLSKITWKGQSIIRTSPRP